jgi:hypothetical protein
VDARVRGHDAEVVAPLRSIHLSNSPQLALQFQVHNFFHVVAFTADKFTQSAQA